MTSSVRTSTDTTPARSAATGDTVLTAAEYPAAVRAGALVVDIRSRAQRERQGVLAGAIAVEAR
ncbi:rhodanese-like domain-containing protein, partial [Dietzia sp. E1]|nr:rhodanese-like domain-containing protein [Dietzia sp. E1]